MVDFRYPEHFFHDVNSVAGALKQFFRDLPDPLLTREQYPAFIGAARKFLFLYTSPYFCAIVDGSKEWVLITMTWGN